MTLFLSPGKIGKYTGGLVELFKGLSNPRKILSKANFIRPFGLQAKPKSGSKCYFLSIGGARLSLVLGDPSTSNLVKEGETCIHNDSKQATVHLDSKNNANIQANKVYINKIEFKEALEAIKQDFNLCNGAPNLASNLSALLMPKT